jgi:translation initiation factor 3 subunit E
MKELVKIIQQESYNYSDPITELVRCLYVNFDFDGAQVKLRECDQVIETNRTARIVEIILKKIFFS